MRGKGASVWEGQESFERARAFLKEHRCFKEREFLKGHEFTRAV
jgi:hypothetical protein